MRIWVFALCMLMTLLFNGCALYQNEYTANRIRDALDIVTVGLTSPAFASCRVSCLSLGINGGFALVTYVPDKASNGWEYQYYTCAVPWASKNTHYFVYPSDAAALRGKAYCVHYPIPCIALPSPPFPDTQSVFSEYRTSIQSGASFYLCSPEKYFNIDEIKDSPNYTYSITDSSTPEYYNYHALIKNVADSQSYEFKLFRPKTPPSYLYYGDIAIDAGAIFGVHVRVNPIELVDFLLGFTTLDIGLDDKHNEINAQKHLKSQVMYPGATLITK